MERVYAVVELARGMLDVGVGTVLPVLVSSSQGVSTAALVDVLVDHGAVELTWLLNAVEVELVYEDVELISSSQGSVV